MPGLSSFKDVSTSLATNGIAAITSDTVAALGPSEVPATALVNGISTTIKIINGIERPILTITLRRQFRIGFGAIEPGSVIVRITPSGSPNRYEKRVEKKTMYSVALRPSMNKS
jgi:hypothetical protein